MSTLGSSLAYYKRCTTGKGRQKSLPSKVLQGPSTLLTVSEAANINSGACDSRPKVARFPIMHSFQRARIPFGQTCRTDLHLRLLSNSRQIQIYHPLL